MERPSTPPASGDGGAPEEGYTGPPIGSVAKAEWPELLGADVDAAVAAIEAERPDLLLVQPTREASVSGGMGGDVRATSSDGAAWGLAGTIGNSDVPPRHQRRRCRARSSRQTWRCDVCAYGTTPIES
jgi:hypothetical protein